MKKLIFIVCIFGCVVSLLYAGGQAEEKTTKEAGSVPITFTIWGEEAKLKTHEEVVNAFETENPDITIDMIAIPGAQYQQKVLTMIAGGTPPDVINCSEDFTYSFYKKGLLINLRTELEKTGFLDDSKHFTNLFNAFTDPDTGAIFAVPTGSNINVLFYNKTMFEKEGLDLPTDSWTWNDLVEAGKKLTKDTDGDGKKDQYAISVGNLITPIFYQDILWSFGGHWLDNPLNPTETIIDTPEAKKAMQFMQDLRYKYHIAPTAAEEGALQGGFATGRTAMEINGTWMMAFHKEIEDFEWDIVYIPKGTRRAVSYAVGGWGVTKASKHIEEAKRVALFWGGPVFQTENCITLGLVTPLTRELAYSDDFLTLRGDAPPNHKIRMDGLEGSHFRSLIHTNGPEIMDIFQKETDNLLMNKKSPEEFVNTVKPKVDELLAQ